MVKQRVKNLFFWAPRALSILFILFLGLFALDVFGAGEPFLQVLLALFMHLIPNFILIIILLIAWRNEKIGGILFILLGLIFTLFFKVHEWLNFFLIIFPLFVIGILFFVDWYINKRSKQKKKKFSF